MNLRPNQLAAHLERTLAPVYVIHGDEPLLAMEAGDDIRAAARKAGCDEREVLVVEKGFDWDAFRAANANLGLFGSRKLVDLRIPSGKPGSRGREGARSGCGLSCLGCESRHRAARHAAAARSRRAGVGMVHRARRRRRRDRGVRARTRRAACLDRGAARAAGTASERRDARVPRRPLRGQPVRGEAGDREARPAAARGRDSARGGRARRHRRRALRHACSSRKRGSPATPRARCTDHRRSKPKARAAVAAVAAGRGPACARRDPRAIAARERRSPSRCATRASGAGGRRRWSARPGACPPAAVTPMLRALARLDALSKGIGAGNAWDELRDACADPRGPPCRSARCRPEPGHSRRSVFLRLPSPDFGSSASLSAPAPLPLVEIRAQAFVGEVDRRTNAPSRGARPCSAARRRDGCRPRAPARAARRNCPARD